MEVTMYWYPKCGTCRSAMKWLKAHGYTVNEVHIVEKPPTVPVLKEMIAKSGLELKKWFNVSGNVYKDMGLKDKLPAMTEAEKLKLLASNGMLVKRPIVTDGNRVTIGYKEDQYEQVWGSAE